MILDIVITAYLIQLIIVSTIYIFRYETIINNCIDAATNIAPGPREEYDNWAVKLLIFAIFCIPIKGLLILNRMYA